MGEREGWRGGLPLSLEKLYRRFFLAAGVVGGGGDLVGVVHGERPVEGDGKSIPRVGEGHQARLHMQQELTPPLLA